MRDVTGVDQEGWLHLQRRDLRHRLFQRVDGVRVGGLVEADMAVRYLQEGESGRKRLGCLGLAEQIERFGNAA